MLENQKCIVTGASSGIGKATCEILSNYGATVIGIGRNQVALLELKEKGQITDYVVSDLTSKNQCEKVVKESIHLLDGKLTSLINCAGVLKGGSMDNVDVSNYHENMDINTRVPFEMMTHSIPYLKENESSTIINISSVNGKQAFMGCVAYCMSKAALDQLTRCASIDLAKYGIRVNAINPGVIETNLQKAGGLSDEQYSKFLEHSINSTHPLSKSLGRVGKPEEVGELVAFLISDKAKFLTGECIAIDGGRQNLGAR